MRLRTKVFLSIIPIVGMALLVTGWLVIDFARRTSHDVVYRYCEGVLDSYITQDLASRIDLLEANKLTNVTSFVKSFQKEALTAAEELNLIWTGCVFITDSKRNILFSSREMPR